MVSVISVSAGNTKKLRLAFPVVWVNVFTNGTFLTGVGGVYLKKCLASVSGFILGEIFQHVPARVKDSPVEPCLLLGFVRNKSSVFVNFCLGSLGHVADF